ncbi:hypothetical protein [Lentzea guizhouensis]|nr:hypothetical protein [Lentzea guizhouensis]
MKFTGGTDLLDREGRRDRHAELDPLTAAIDELLAAGSVAQNPKCDQH